MRDQGRAPMARYVVVTFAWTWSLWWTAALWTEPPDVVLAMLFMTGGLGPLVGAACVVGRCSKAYRRAFVRRIWDSHGIPRAWWLALVAVAAAPALLGAGLAGLAGAPEVAPDYTFGTVGAVIAFAFAAGFVEEPGWRGAASDVWQVRTRPVFAAMGIGVFWAIWHLPLYFIEGSYQYGLGFGSLRFWLTNFVLVELGVLYLWLSNGAGGSILIAILAHAGFNVAGELVPRSTAGDLIAFAIVTVATSTVIVVTKGRLSYSPAWAREREPVQGVDVTPFFAPRE